jgi:hypothetical protein
MIVNSDERQWAWMDEGLTTFVQYLNGTGIRTKTTHQEEVKLKR